MQSPLTWKTYKLCSIKKVAADELGQNLGECIEAFLRTAGCQPNPNRLLCHDVRASADSTCSVAIEQSGAVQFGVAGSERLETRQFVAAKHQKVVGQ